ncbi:hypothetical protein KVR01_009337 [Diaporthe batatas]|uniref:uncharacterized protein n=1 Tax=Diaporthe batatas TaxID=748121 RepID=UPI001D03AB2A|nr:uncharacterized protein KVR01_009337 [Diaporthe batatas]KAG8161073.1 hypothetical protein KVR01_009337 [Diaporthe batatas]
MAYTTKDLILPDSVGCYATEAVTYLRDTYNTLGGCSYTCREAGYPVFAAQLMNCACLDILPSYDEKAEESLCNQPCPGYAGETCGGQSGYYTVGTVPGVLVTPSRAPSSSTSTTQTITTTITSNMTASVSSSQTSPATAVVSPSHTPSNDTVPITSASPAASSGSSSPAVASSATTVASILSAMTVLAALF